MTSPVFYAHLTLNESEVADLMRGSSSFLIHAETSIMRFNSSAVELDFIAYTRDFIPSQR